MKTLEKLDKIDTLYAFNKIHISMIRNICPIINSMEKRNKNEKYTRYEFNNDLINKHKKIAEFRKLKNDECMF